MHDRPSVLCTRWLVSSGLLLMLAGCTLVPDPRPSERVVVASWNVQNLFDEVSDGDEYPEFDPARGWTRARFWARCSRLAEVIRTLGDRGPEVLVLEEVEGAHALEVLRTRFLGDLGYRFWFLAPDSEPGVKTAVLSRYPFVRTALLRPPSEESQPLRPLVEVELDLGGRSLVVIGNHWKSRIPTPAATEALRRASARLLARRIARLESRAERPLVVAVGDFNTSIELSRTQAQPALISGSAALANEEALVVYSTRRAAEAADRSAAVWDPWSEVASPRGSYVYQGDWDRLDHAFVALSGLHLPDWSVESFGVVAFAPLPLAYGPRTPQGVSDHFPVVLTLVRRGTVLASP